MGLAAAAGFGAATPLIIPENGWISLNPPLTANRLGSCSTRTTHPYFLEGLTGLWRDAGLNNPLVNPYADRTKGEMVGRSRNRGLLGRLFRLSISCARPVVSRWRGGTAGACGYCYPCLMRRAALHTQGWDEGADYHRDVFAEPETLAHRVRGRDLRALLAARRTWEEAPAEVEARLVLGGAGSTLPARLAAARRVLDRGFGEMAAWLKDRGPEWVKDYGN